MLQIKNIYKSYNKKEILNDVNLKVDNEIKVLLGINGCGKSTLLKIITGINNSDSGNIYLNDKEITGLPPEKRRIGYVPQRTALFNNLTVYENITYGLRDKNIDKDSVDKIINMLELEEYLHLKPKQLSGGYKSRVSLARALVPMPHLMLLDEPLSDVDIVMKEKLLPEFRKVIQVLNIPTIYVTHDPLEASQVGDSFCAMIDGCIQNAGSALEAFDIIKRKEHERIDNRFREMRESLV